MAEKSPRVSVGLPVYNGEQFVADALESILAESYRDIEVIVSDNASTDRTREICQSFAERDPRVRYYRSEKNLGAAPNFNRTFELSRGEYFRWSAHDDTTHPGFLAKCVEVLDRDSSVVLCHSKVRIIDVQGKHVEDPGYAPQTDSESPRKRFFDLLFVKNRCFEVFGLMRSDVLRQTGGIGAFPVGDRVLLSELAFRGRFHEISECLFYSREHADRSVRRLPTQHDRAAWFDSRYKGRITFPEWRALTKYWGAIRRSPLRGRDRLMSYLYMLKWLRHYRNRLGYELLVGASRWWSGKNDNLDGDP